MRIIVQRAKCQGHARCAAKAPDIFKGYILPGDIEITAGEYLLATRGAQSCPESALEVDCEPAAQPQPNLSQKSVRRA
ncbi:ferredoxin [Mesorhizobium sp. C416B]|uniref:ferredoxin n=1 Tax=unclassified Mesorhizobium TaxID=325217 RepID=UPI0003CE61DD|nr:MULTISPECIES: ferredoxin [unclassified Mesorhizobium]ESX47256.1 ferredoxin [Mesorhizobium sp. LSHC424B00]ESX65024.1 ferredoxin [Mesorhizobium sp. LSHC416B00]WJI65520.1 ferredoxin [Mesorhizobium sp. C416B]